MNEVKFRLDPRMCIKCKNGGFTSKIGLRASRRDLQCHALATKKSGVGHELAVQPLGLVQPAAEFRSYGEISTRTGYASKMCSGTM